MKLNQLWFLFFSLTFLFLFAENHASDSQFLKVGIVHSPPFAIKDKYTKIWQGLGVELFQYIAEKRNLPYNFIEIKDTNDLQALKAEYDILIGDFPYNVKLLENFQLSIPYYATGYGALTKNNKNNSIIIFDVFHNLFSFSFLYFMFFVFLFMLIIAIFMWLIERNKNENFPTKMGPGIFNGLWWTIFNCGGIGAEIYPITRRGRLFGMFAVCFSIIVLSHVVGIISSLLTTERLGKQVSSLKDLRDKRIGAVLDKENDIGEFLHSYHLNYQPFNDLEDAVNKLRIKKIGAVIASAPTLKYYLKKTLSDEVTFSPLDLGTNYYGFLVNMNSKIMFDINTEILKITDTALWRDLLFRYLNESSK